MTIEEDKMDFVGEVITVFTDRLCKLGLFVGDVEIKGPAELIAPFYRVGKKLRITIREIEKE